ncbi:NUDIX domain-containing protein [Fodinicola acaciae]|uniref:NUDIX domain-containing protein n=1 Tax=Fodinicola acaciae TaxID=2681555 RepID=UPI0013CF49D5|nr:NUDIX hydrolase [Fodinicola acaciae]
MVGEPPRTAAVMLVDPDGRVLLQLRDGNAPVGRHKWAVPGGGVEPGEHPESAARREIREETGIELTGKLELFWYGTRAFSLDHPLEWFVYCAPTAVRQEDVVVGEGAAMVFVPPQDIQALDLAQGARHFLTLFLASAAYDQLRRR